MKSPTISVYLEITQESTRGLVRGILLYAKLYTNWNIQIDSNFGSMFYRTEQPRRPDGIIAWPNNPKVIRRLVSAAQYQIPTILVDPWEEYDLPELSGASRLVCDSEKLGRMAADFFLERGFKKFAFCGEANNVNWSRWRGEGFAGRLAEFVYQVQEYPNPKFKKYNSREEIPYLSEWLQNLSPHTGLLVAMDIRAQQIMHACNWANIPVPERLSVLSIDNDEILCQIPNPAVSSIQMDNESAGYNAAQLLDQIIKKETDGPQVIRYGASRIISRGSTATVQTEDPVVEKAVEIIRVHAGTVITIPEILKRLDVSRRNLERRFQQELGRSILDEILRQRMERLKKLLAETVLPMKKLAELCGFQNENYMGKAFRKRFGTSMTEFRALFLQGAGVCTDRVSSNSNPNE